MERRLYRTCTETSIELLLGTFPLDLCRHRYNYHTSSSQSPSVRIGIDKIIRTNYSFIKMAEVRSYSKGIDILTQEAKVFASRSSKPSDPGIVRLHV